MEKQLQKVLRDEIPLTNAIGLEVESISDVSVCLKAPLENNINHKLTAFGGSLYSVAVLTGWSMVYVLLKRLNIDAHIVIQHSEIDYLLPVKENFTACSEDLSEFQITKFEKMYKRKNRSRIMIDVIIKSEGKRAVHFSGDYVVHS